MFRTANPALKESTFSQIQTSSGVSAADRMTVGGTVNKASLLLILVIAGAGWTWHLFAAGSNMVPWVIFGALGGFATALVTIFKKEISPITAPIYAVLQGLFLGGISAVVNKTYPGIPFQAVGLTFGVLGCLLLAYRSGLIKATENFKLGVVAATGAIAAYYLASIVLGFFGVTVPLIHSNGIYGIIFSLVVIVIAALNLVLDFDFIETGERTGAPKYMEWYGAFGLMVTLIWLYLEILRLLTKLQSRK